MTQIINLKVLIDDVVIKSVPITLDINSSDTTTKKLAFTSLELAKELNINIDKIHLLRQLNAIKCIKKGREYIYPLAEVETFLRDYINQDLSNAQAIRESVYQVALNKKR